MFTGLVLTVVNRAAFNDKRKTRRKENVSPKLLRKKSVTAKKAMTNRTKSEFTSHCRIAAKTNFLMLLFSASFAPARYSSRMIDRFLNWGDHGKPKSGKIKGRCQRPLVYTSPDLLARFCKVNLSNAKKFGLIFFPGLINLTVIKSHYGS